MINSLKYLITSGFNPYKNLALEEYLLDLVKPGECILYLWQNERTVVIGKNQNPWKECKVKELEADGGYLVRRLSGGGAVFHDHGNLNFTFLIHKDDYDVDKQLNVIITALAILGIEAEKSGRNDITVDGKKFSGNAFYTKGNKSYHHGTILVDVDMNALSTYLNVSKEKLVSKGVTSVKSRVTNLTAYRPDLTIDLMKETLIKGFSRVYRLEAKPMEAEEIDQKELDFLYQKFSSWQWKYGRKIQFSNEISRRFPWGDIALNLEVNEGLIKEVVVFSDSMDLEISQYLPIILKDCLYDSKNMIEAIDQLAKKHVHLRSMLEDIKDMIRQEI